MTTKPPWLVTAESYIGFKEGPNNDTPFGKDYNLNHQPWCALFVSDCCRKSGHKLPVMQPGMTDGFAGVEFGMSWAKARGYWVPSWRARPGDIIVYGWNGPASSAADMHTGFVSSSGPRGTTGHTVEGNRGDQVERQTFTVGERIVLGVIQANRILADHKDGTIPGPKPSPQPKHPKHPKNTGPNYSAFYRAWLRFVKRWHHAR